MARTLTFGYDGDAGLGDRLLAAVLRGEKTATSSLAVEYLSGEPLPRVGERLRLVDHAGGVHGTVETTRVTITPLHLVSDQVALDEGEGFRDADKWRRDHIAFWPRWRNSSGATPETPTGSSARPNPLSCTGSGCCRRRSRTGMTHRTQQCRFRPRIGSPLTGQR